MKPVALKECVHLFACVYPSVFVCLHFISGSDPKGLGLLVPFAPLSIKGRRIMPVPQSPGLQAAYLHGGLTRLQDVL